MAELNKTQKAQFDDRPAPPVAERRPFQKVTHGRVLDDPYAWLAAENWRDVLRDPKTLPKDIAAVVKAENAYCAQVVAPLAALRRTLVAEMRARIKEDDADVPDPDGPFAYYGRFRDGRRTSALLPHRRREGGAGRRSCWTADACAKGMISSTSAKRRTRPTIGSSHGVSTTRAPNSTSSARAPSLRDRIATTPSPTRTAQSSGAPIHRPSIMCASTTITEPAQVFRHEIGADPGNGQADRGRARRRLVCRIAMKADVDASASFRSRAMTRRNAGSSICGTPKPPRASLPRASRSCVTK